MTPTPDLLHDAWGIALALVLVAGFCLALWFIDILVDGRKLRRKQRVGYPVTPQQREAYARMQKLRDEVGPAGIFEDEETKTWPGPGAAA